MNIDESKKCMHDSLIWGNWSKFQADAIRTLLLEVERVTLLEEENAKLRERLTELESKK